MPEVLPDHLLSLLASAEKLATFLRRTGFPHREMIRDLEEVSSAEGLLRAYERTRANHGLLGFAEGTIRRVHSSAEFDGHVRTEKVRGSGVRIPRLRVLLPGRPEPEFWQAEVVAAFAEGMRQRDTVRGNQGLGTAAGLVRFYFYSTAFDELDHLRLRRELPALLFVKHTDAGLQLLEAREDLDSFPEILAPLLHEGARYFGSNRYFERSYEFARLLLERFGERDNAIGVTLERLWYAAFRTGRLEEAREALELWSALKPTLKRPLVYQAIVASVRAPEEAVELLEDSGAALGRSSTAGNVLYAEQALQQGRLREAERAIRHAIDDREMQSGAEVSQDYLIALHNVSLARGRPSRALDPVFLEQGLSLDWDESFGLDQVRDNSPASASLAGRVAVIMTAYQAEKYILRAMKGVLGQSHKDLELIVVDDCSTDRTGEIARGTGDPRVICLRTPRNMGTYAAKNIGIRQALDNGANYIALCDSDDYWLHNHIAVHLAAMADVPEAMCSTSQWMRVRDDGTIECGLRGRYVETCPHSTFFRSEVFARAGYFDAVRFGADREFLNRVMLHFGRGAVVDISRILTLGRRHDASLTTSGAGALTEFNESPVRLRYWRDWNEWQVAEMRRNRLPYTDGTPNSSERPFPVPDEMRV